MRAPKLLIGSPLYLRLPLGPMQVKVIKITAKYVYAEFEDGQRVGLRKDEALQHRIKPTQQDLDREYLWSNDQDRPTLREWL